MLIKSKKLRSSGKTLWILTFVSIFISGCGGGGSSSSSASSTGSPSSTLALTNGSNGGIAAVLELQQIDDVSLPLLERITQFIVPSVWAGIDIFLNNFSYGSKETGETLYIAVTAGSYTLKMVDDENPNISCTYPLTIENDQIVSLTVNDINAPNCNVTDLVHKDVDNDLIAGGDNAPAGKTLACHKNKFNIAISFDALDAHLAHGDTAGPCPVDQPDNDVAEAESSKGNSNKPSKPDKPGKPKA